MKEQIMKNFYSLFLLINCLMLSCTDSSAADSNQDPLDNYSSTQRSYNRWGEDVVYAAIYPYGWQKSSFENYDGKMFPIYWGYISYDNQGEQKMVYFTSSDNHTTRSLDVTCEDINSSRGMSSGDWWISIDEPDFCGSLRGMLFNLAIWEVIRLPLGTAKDFDFSFREQTEFKLEEAEELFWRGELVKFPAEWGISEENLIMTPKQ